MTQKQLNNRFVFEKMTPDCKEIDWQEATSFHFWNLNRLLSIGKRLILRRIHKGVRTVFNWIILRAPFKKAQNIRG